MKIIHAFIVAGGLFWVSCSPDGQAANNAANSSKMPAADMSSAPSDAAPVSATADAASPAAEVPNAQSSKSTMKDHELMAYFQPSDADMLVTCTDEKGPSDSYYEGKPIPMSLVEKYELYQFNMSPPMRLKYKLPNPLVTVVGGTALGYKDHQVLIYSVGIGMESEDAPVDEGVDTRALVINAAGEITGNYFVAGFMRREGRDEESVCRKLSFKGNEIVLTIIEEATTNIPGHLRLEDVETRDL